MIGLYSGYLASCRDIVTATRTIADAITDDIPELYVLGNPPSSVVAFGSKHPKVDPLEVGDAMRDRGWHLNGLSDPKSVHIACTVRFVVPIHSLHRWRLNLFFRSLSASCENFVDCVRVLLAVTSYSHCGEINQLAQRLTLSVVDTFIADLKDCVYQAKLRPSGKGTMVALYGMFPFFYFSLYPFSPSICVL